MIIGDASGDSPNGIPNGTPNGTPIGTFECTKDALKVVNSKSYSGNIALYTAATSGKSMFTNTDGKGWNTITPGLISNPNIPHNFECKRVPKNYSRWHLAPYARQYNNKWTCWRRNLENED